MGVEGPPGIITLESCAVKEKSEMRWLVFLSVATHSYDFSSETDGEDPTGSHELASVLDTHPNGRLHQHWAAGTSCVSVTLQTPTTLHSRRFQGWLPDHMATWNGSTPFSTLPSHHVQPFYAPFTLELGSWGWPCRCRHEHPPPLHSRRFHGW